MAHTGRPGSVFCAPPAFRLEIPPTPARRLPASAGRSRIAHHSVVRPAAQDCRPTNHLETARLPRGLKLRGQPFLPGGHGQGTALNIPFRKDMMDAPPYTLSSRA